jgi:hypothetical protein
VLDVRTDYGIQAGCAPWTFWYLFSAQRQE